MDINKNNILVDDNATTSLDLLSGEEDKDTEDNNDKVDLGNLSWFEGSSTTIIIRDCILLL
eukprot:15352108-Ditylum_brightwellii.AAC.1